MAISRKPKRWKLTVKREYSSKMSSAPLRPSDFVLRLYRARKLVAENCGTSAKLKFQEFLGYIVKGRRRSTFEIDVHRKYQGFIESQKSQKRWERDTKFKWYFFASLQQAGLGIVNYDKNTFVCDESLDKPTLNVLTQRFFDLKEEELSEIQSYGELAFTIARIKKGAEFLRDKVANGELHNKSPDVQELRSFIDGLGTYGQNQMANLRLANFSGLEMITDETSIEIRLTLKGVKRKHKRDLKLKI